MAGIENYLQAADAFAEITKDIEKAQARAIEVGAFLTDYNRSLVVAEISLDGLALVTGLAGDVLLAGRRYQETVNAMAAALATIRPNPGF